MSWAVLAVLVVLSGTFVGMERARRLRAEAEREGAISSAREALAASEEVRKQSQERADAEAAEITRQLAEVRNRSEATLIETRRAAEGRVGAANRARDELAVRLRRAEAEIASLRLELADAEAERDRLNAIAADAELQRAERGALEETVAMLQAKIAGAERELVRLRESSSRDPSRALFARLQQAERKVEESRELAEQWMHRATEAEAELARREALPEHEAIASERDALRGRVEVLEEAARRSAGVRSTLRALGLPALPNDAQLFLPERRELTEAALREATIAAQAAGSAIVDARGGMWARCGNGLVVERLAASASLFAGADPAPALGRPAQIASELYGVYGRHIIALHGTELRLGVTGSRECPTLALRLASLRMVGLSPAPRPEHREPTMLELDPVVSDRLGAWAARRSALAVAVFGLGEPAGTDSVFAGACQALGPAVRALFARARRDGFGPGFAVIWRGEDEVSLAARVLDDGQTLVFAKFNAPPAPRVLDDLTATLRWIEPRVAA